MSALFTPIKLGSVEFTNRIVVAPMCQYSADDGTATDWHLAHLGMLANSGAGLVIVEATHVERRGRITHGCMGLYFDDNESSLARVIATAGGAGTAKLGIQIAHAGRKASSQRPWEGWRAAAAGSRPVADDRPIAHPFGPNWHVPRMATGRHRAGARGVCQFREALGADRIRRHRAALRARLTGAFVPVTQVSNHRTDQYGGSLENRMRFGLEIARAVRAAVPKTIALGARITGSDWRDDGLSIDDAVTYSKALKGCGLDYIDVSSGGITADTRNPTGPGYNVPIAERIKREADVATRVGRADRHAVAGRGHRRRRQGRHGGARPRHARRSALGLARGSRTRCRGAARAAISARRAKALGASRRARPGMT